MVQMANNVAYSCAGGSEDYTHKNFLQFLLSIRTNNN